MATQVIENTANPFPALKCKGKMGCNDARELTAKAAAPVRLDVCMVMANGLPNGCARGKIRRA
jgi:hypothetical protein